MELGLRDRVFVVTAASTGLGLATATSLVSEGARVALVARRSQALALAVQNLGGADHAVALTADLGAADTPQRAVDLALTSFGRLDGAFISVGGPPKGRVLQNTDQQWADAFEYVFMAALRSVRAVLAVNKSARLGLVLSTSVKSPMNELAISNGFRPGLGMLIKQLADEIGPDGGRVFGLMPGWMATDRTKTMMAAAADPQAALQAAESAVPLRRTGAPEELGQVAAFMLSDVASYVTGCVIPVDGGSLRCL